jgi:hypothetical protein
MAVGRLEYAALGGGGGRACSALKSCAAQAMQPLESAQLLKHEMFRTISVFEMPLCVI